MAILDIVVLLMLVLGAVIGFKKGLIKTLVSLIGIILVIVLSYYFKDPIANFLITYLPFFSFGGYFEGLTALNFLLYETVSFIFVFIILSCILGILINISGIIEKILNATIVLGIFSKILGAIAGILEMLAIVYVALFALSQFNVSSKLVMDSSVSRTILAKTPILSYVVGGSYNAISEINDLHEKYINEEDKTSYNIEAISIMIKYRIIDASIVQKAIDNNKLPGLENAVFY